MMGITLNTGIGNGGVIEKNNMEIKGGRERSFDFARRPWEAVAGIRIQTLV
jgi:hypothetical protein